MSTVSIKTIPVTFSTSTLSKVEMKRETLQANVAFRDWRLCEVDPIMPVNLLITNVPSDIATELSGLRAAAVEVYIEIEAELKPVCMHDSDGESEGWYFEAKYAGRFEVR